MPKCRSETRRASSGRVFGQRLLETVDVHVVVCPPRAFWVNRMMEAPKISIQSGPIRFPRLLRRVFALPRRGRGGVRPPLPAGFSQGRRPSGVALARASWSSPSGWPTPAAASAFFACTRSAAARRPLGGRVPRRTPSFGPAAIRPPRRVIRVGPMLMVVRRGERRGERGDRAAVPAAAKRPICESLSSLLSRLLPIL